MSLREILITVALANILHGWSWADDSDQDASPSSTSSGKQLQQELKRALAGAVSQGLDSGSRIVSTAIACAIARQLGQNPGECAEGRGGDDESKTEEGDRDQSGGGYGTAATRRSASDPPTAERSSRSPRSANENRLTGNRDEPVSDQDQALSFLKGFWCQPNTPLVIEMQPVSESEVMVHSLQCKNCKPVKHRVTQPGSKLFQFSSRKNDKEEIVVWETREAMEQSEMHRVFPTAEGSILRPGGGKCRAFIPRPQGFDS